MEGAQNPNSWFTPKKLKGLAHTIEAAKNNHVGSNPISKEIQAELLNTMPAMAEFQYWNFRNRQQQIIEFQEKLNSCDLDSMYEKLPAKLRSSVGNYEENPIPEIIQPLLKYTEQMQVFLPVEERRRYNLMLKINHPPKIKLDSED